VCFALYLVCTHTLLLEVQLNINIVACPALLCLCRTVTDLGSGSTKLGGVLIAALSVVGSGMQQILCGYMQRLHKMQSHQLLAATAPAQGLMLLVIGPWVDKAVSGSWVGHYVITSPALALIVMSCLIAVGVNISQFMCLGRFSAATFQVLGHTKTILVLLISWLALGESMSAKKLLGMAVAVAGMVAYGVFVNQATTPSSKSSGGVPPLKSGEQQPLLPVAEKRQPA
jgi:solute carrier family 35 protein E3